MEIFLHNTLTGKKETFVPLKKGLFGRPKVGMYHCGPTVYWNQQIGNMRAMVEADIIRRTFLYNGFKVNFVRNYTDVGHLTGDNLGDADTGEDRMEKASKREHLSPDQIADKYIESFERDTRLLNILEPTHKPRATRFIGDMINMVETLMEKGFAYSTPLAVYFDIRKFPDYTKLSGQKLGELETGEGHGNVSGDPNKRNPQDFSLWFFKAGVHTNALQTWKSPFSSPLVKDGEGFPGWHIECSAMSRHFLGPTVDVHMGGVEHIPIHHTNEIAQSEAANGKKFVNYWLHNEHLLVDGRRMGKSEGNAYVMEDILKNEVSPLALRYFFLQAHYRSKQNFTWEALSAAETALGKLLDFTAGISGNGKVLDEYKQRFLELVNDDFNVTGALSVVWELVKDANVKDTDKRATLLDFDEVLGLGLSSLRTEKKNTVAIPPEVRKLADERKAARDTKDWKKSDELRDKISSLGFDIKDTSEGQKITKK